MIVYKIAFIIFVGLVCPILMFTVGQHLIFKCCGTKTTAKVLKVEIIKCVTLKGTKYNMDKITCIYFVDKKHYLKTLYSTDKKLKGGDSVELRYLNKKEDKSFCPEFEGLKSNKTLIFVFLCILILFVMNRF